ncbi:SWIM zinc finger family protein [Actinoplanes oblitus]|uniref:SWIM zinc finger family protein n=1 Tax=Actinoplanes oblitus TaxID=3040509 RepID=A0ABY8WBR9_9ACTN|nr:SWIM zinc finger family protein [Actinoplanes oblitus]WIM94927.1 SWIM zinc finger family protein [Actinoplanes oblitus]
MPIERWSVAQAESLAPDPAALKRARSVSGQFGATGTLDQIVWGLVRGYQVAADLAGPAFKCSCPSFRAPCKHAVGLVLHWAEAGAGDHPAPDWVTTWQTARAARAKARTSPPDPVAAAKRARERAERVAGGLAELRRWLDDQIEQGLAGLGRRGHQAFEPMAARLVDAQAPGAASAVRRLGGIAGIGPQWADRLLGELATLHLLVAGHARLGALDPAMAATVRSRIGFPTPAEEVLAGPRASDRWQVLGQVDSDDGALTTRRTWLHGAATSRFALVLSFAAPGQSLAADLVPGTEFRGDLCFYPGAAPLRALVADRTSAAEPFGSPDGAGSVRAALSRWSRLLADDPFRYDGPLLLAGVTPTGDGWLVDPSGDALPLAAGHREPWWLLAAAGGRPASVAAEWSPGGLRPLAAWVGGAFVPAGPPVPDPGAPRQAELPPEMLAAALVGTARRPWQAESVRVGPVTVGIGPDALSPVEPVTAGVAPDALSPVEPVTVGIGHDALSPVGLLDAAAVALTTRRAGFLPVTGRSPVEPAPEETEPPLPVAAGVRLSRILRGGTPGGAHLEQELLAQWLAAAVARGGVVPPVLLPELLDAARRNTTVRSGVARVAGRRGAWLAWQRPDWGWLLDEATPVTVTDWTTATGTERLGHLITLRRTDPAQARRLVESTWGADSSENRARFLGTFADGLAADDEDLLERALDDRRKEVRQTAVELLRRLPASALAARMRDRAHAAVRLLPGDPARLVVEPPDRLDDDLRRDGVGATPAHGIGASAWLLEEVVAGAPLASWADLEPVGYLALARGNDWATPLLHGWAKAAIAQGDARWAAALLATDAGVLREAVRWDLHLVLPPDALARLAAEALRAEDGTAHRLLALHPGPWPEPLSVTVLETIATRARTDRHTWQLGELCRTAALAMPPDYADLTGRLATQLEPELDAGRVRPVADLARTLAFRAEMRAELAPESVTPGQ